MTDIPRTPFKIGQPHDKVLVVAKMSHRRRLGVEITAKEGIFLIDCRRKNTKQVSKELDGLSINLAQDGMVFRIFYLDCTLKFRRYRGLGGNGHNCYRIVKIDAPIDISNLLTVKLPETEPAISPEQLS